MQAAGHHEACWLPRRHCWSLAFQARSPLPCSEPFPRSRCKLRPDYSALASQCRRFRHTTWRWELALAVVDTFWHTLSLAASVLLEANLRCKPVLPRHPMVVLVPLPQSRKPLLPSARRSSSLSILLSLYLEKS
jgi:hypothetical protein